MALLICLSEGDLSIGIVLRDYESGEMFLKEYYYKNQWTGRKSYREAVLFNS